MEKLAAVKKTPIQSTHKLIFHLGILFHLPVKRKVS
jgi:hypothetical protein